jgi:hypothetical protein
LEGVFADLAILGVSGERVFDVEGAFRMIHSIKNTSIIYFCSVCFWVASPVSSQTEKTFSIVTVYPATEVECNIGDGSKNWIIKLELGQFIYNSEDVTKNVSMVKINDPTATESNVESFANFYNYRVLHAYHFNGKSTYPSYQLLLDWRDKSGSIYVEYYEKIRLRGHCKYKDFAFSELESSK